MKKHIQQTIWFLAPIALWAQVQEPASTEIDLAEVTVVEDDVNSVTPNTTTAEIVEIPDAPVEGARIDSEAPIIPEVTESLPVDTEIVLEIPGQGSSLPGQASLDTEETISVDFPDEDVRTILRNVADLFELNLVIPDTLQGRTSIKLRNISWRQAFEVVLDPLGYTYVEDRNIIRIKSIEDLTTEPVDTRVFVVNYAKAGDLQNSITPLVNAAAGGRIQVDARSNALVITERPSRMNKIQEIIERLDKATSQVMIESKFVEIRSTSGSDLGVDWSSLGGENGGINFELSETFSTLTNDANLTAPGLTDPLNRNPLDTAVFSSTSFGAVLKALDSRNNIELVSNPTVVTMDNEEALIKITREFPQPDFTFNAETGQRQFNGLGDPIDVGITLKVTPTVNAAGFINLDIFPEVSSTTEDRVIEGTLFPIRDVRTAQTRIMIKDGYTLALGGLVTRNSSQSDNKVPFLGDLPGIGRLFSSETEEVVESNLIIFITAKTLNPDGTTYRDTVDPRMLERMEITPDRVPGYQVPSDQKAQLDQLEQLRLEASELEAKGIIQQKIEAK
jgi:type IV pilus assembly protein PilQ